MTSVTVELGLMHPDGTPYTEAQMAKGGIAEFDSMDGWVRLRHGEQSFDVGDLLLYAVGTLCETVVPELTGDGVTVYAAFGHQEELTFTRKGDVITISSAWRPGITLPAEPLLRALVGAGQRFVAMLPALWQGAHPEDIAEYAGQVTAAAASLPPT